MTDLMLQLLQMSELLLLPKKFVGLDGAAAFRRLHLKHLLLRNVSKVPDTRHHMMCGSWPNI